MPAIKALFYVLTLAGWSVAGYGLYRNGLSAPATTLLVVGVGVGAAGVVGWVVLHATDVARAYVMGRRDEAETRDRNRRPARAA